MPDVEAVTAHFKMAPAAMSKMLTEIPMWFLSLGADDLLTKSAQLNVSTHSDANVNQTVANCFGVSAKIVA